MVFLNLWRRDGVRCVLMVESAASRHYRLRLVQDDIIVRERLLTSGGEAAAICREWEQEIGHVRHTALAS